MVRTRTRVVSKPIPDPGDLLGHLPTRDALCWIRGTDGFVAWGEHARLQVSGPDRFAITANWWRELTEGLDVDDRVGVPGSGPVAFASYTFDDATSETTSDHGEYSNVSERQCVAIVPKVVIGRRDGAAWLTTFDDATMPTPTRVQPLGRIRYSDGDISSADYESAVQKAISRIETTQLEKVVLARDLVATSSGPVDPRALLRPLSEAYPGCWTFAVAGLVGSTPELLVRRTGDHIVSRVLAGTSSRSTDAVVDAQHAAGLLASDKDREEHELAVRSVAEALAPFCSDLVVPRAPEVVRLANVQHLQTDVTGRLANGESALDLAAALHPTAAVCGTPTQLARQAIREH